MTRDLTARVAKATSSTNSAKEEETQRRLDHFNEHENAVVTLVNDLVTTVVFPDKSDDTPDLEKYDESKAEELLEALKDLKDRLLEAGSTSTTPPPRKLPWTSRSKPAAKTPGNSSKRPLL